MKFKPMSIALFTAFALTLFIPRPANAAEVDQQLLPLGTSPFRHEIGRIEEGQIIDCASGQTVTVETIAARTLKTDLFIIGEIHDQISCHQLQHDLILAVGGLHPRLVVGFEFFQREDSPALSAWHTGQISQDDLMVKADWYERGSFNFGYTARVLEAVKATKALPIGLNIPRTLARTISRQGFAALTKEERSLFPGIDQPHPEHHYFIKTIFGAMAVQVPGWFINVYAAQKAWDIIMAESMCHQLHQKGFSGHKGIIIAGSNHVAYGLGIPHRYKARSPRTRIITIVPVQLPSPDEKPGESEHPMMKMMAASQKPSALFSRGLADYVYAVPHQSRPHFISFGASLKQADKGLFVSDVSSGSPADLYGLRKGDTIYAFDGIPLTSVGQFNALMASKAWDDHLELQLRRKGVIGLSEK